MDGRERRNYQRFYVSGQDMRNCLIVDQNGVGHQTHVHNVGVGGLCFEVVSASEESEQSLPTFGPGDEFVFSCSENDNWGRHIRGRTGHISWQDGTLYGLRFDTPVGSAHELALSVSEDLNLLTRLRTRLWEGGLNTHTVLRRLSNDMAALLKDHGGEGNQP